MDKRGTVEEWNEWGTGPAGGASLESGGHCTETVTKIMRQWTAGLEHSGGKLPSHDLIVICCFFNREEVRCCPVSKWFVKKKTIVLGEHIVLNHSQRNWLYQNIKRWKSLIILHFKAKHDVKYVTAGHEVNERFGEQIIWIYLFT